MIRSSRYEVGDKIRYSYVEPDGETYDISDIVEEEWRENNAAANKNDLLEGVLVRNKDGLGEKLDRVLNKIKGGKGHAQMPVSRSTASSIVGSGSEYSMDESANSNTNSRAATPVYSATGGRTPTPTAANNQRATSPYSSFPRTLSPVSTEAKHAKPRATPPAAGAKTTPGSKRQPSIASVMSDLSGYATPPTTVPGSGSPRSLTTPHPQRRRPYLDNDDFGVAHMLAIIEVAGAVPRAPAKPLDALDALLFGRSVDVEALHPQVRGVYADAFKQLDDMDSDLDDFLGRSTGG
jgi:hypothetical protein